jgi:Flp pilus assembly protein TadG
MPFNSRSFRPWLLFGRRRKASSGGIANAARDEGVAAVEFGLLLPLLIAVISAVIDYGYIFFIQNNLTNAAREGARAGITQEDEDDATSEAEEIANDYLENANLDQIAGATASNDGEYVTVTATTNGNFRPLVGFLSVCVGLFPGSVSAYPTSLHASSTMRWEWSAASP